jgi:hypothetical protein
MSFAQFKQVLMGAWLVDCLTHFFLLPPLEWLFGKKPFQSNPQNEFPKSIQIRELWKKI